MYSASTVITDLGIHSPAETSFVTRLVDKVNALLQVHYISYGETTPENITLYQKDLKTFFNQGYIHTVTSVKTSVNGTETVLDSDQYVLMKNAYTKDVFGVDLKNPLHDGDIIVTGIPGMATKPAGLDSEVYDMIESALASQRATHQVLDKTGQLIKRKKIDNKIEVEYHAPGKSEAGSFSPNKTINSVVEEWSATSQILSMHSLRYVIGY